MNINLIFIFIIIELAMEKCRATITILQTEAEVKKAMLYTQSCTFVIIIEKICLQLENPGPSASSFPVHVRRECGCYLFGLRMLSVPI